MTGRVCTLCAELVQVFYRRFNASGGKPLHSQLVKCQMEIKQPRLSHSSLRPNLPPDG